MKPHQVAIGFSGKDSGQDAAEEIAPTLRAGNHATSHANGGNWPAVSLSPSPSPHFSESPSRYAVRRLTPTECERLQGFPDDYTAIPWRSKPASQCPDGPRYKALGNSMAVPVMRWIGQRLTLGFDTTSNPTH
jgi:DNA (cytosine-5)-methyltransferase 1